MIAGLGITLYYIARFKLHWIGSEENSGEANWWWGISPEGFGTVGMLLNFTVALIISRFTPKPDEKVVQMVDDIRVPTASPKQDK